MNYNGFSIDDSHYRLSKEQMAKLTKELQDNSHMYDINKHYDDEIKLLSAIMDEMKKTGNRYKIRNIAKLWKRQIGKYFGPLLQS